MNTSFDHIPEGYHSATPSLTLVDAPAAMAFYQQALGAVERFRIPDEGNGKIKHGEFQIGNSAFLYSSEYDGWGKAPKIGEGQLFMLYVPDCDAAFEQAVAAGATATEDPGDRFWGDRTAGVNDPFGYRWAFAQKVQDVPMEDIAAAAAAWQP